MHDFLKQLSLHIIDVMLNLIKVSTVAINTQKFQRNCKEGYH